jgi:hypothetical protein
MNTDTDSTIRRIELDSPPEMPLTVIFIGAR